MSRLQKQVIEFHRACSIPIATKGPTQLPPDRMRLRADLILEEAFETLRAMVGDSKVVCARLTYFEDEARRTLRMAILGPVDLVEIADGLADLDYVVEGTRLELGINGDPIADEVHRANMTKLDGPKREDGKQLKPPGWVPPDIAGEIERQRESSSRSHAPRPGCCLAHVEAIMVRR
jgi:predicted HAD superfamily Cof-like phosphohydrolase